MNNFQDYPIYKPEDYHQIQINGQRVTSLKSTVNRKLITYIELFISSLPTDADEEEILPHFLKFGPIHQFRLMMCFSGMNRGFGYLVYCNDASAQNALATMKGFAIRPKRKIYVSVSKNYRTLIFNHVQFDMSSSDILYNITFTRPIQVTIGTINHRNRIVLIKFSTNREAALARRVLLLEMQIRFGHKVRLGWFKADSITNFTLHDIFYFN